MNLNSLLGISMNTAIKVKGNSISELVNEPLNYIERMDVLKLGNCLVWQTHDKTRVFVETCDSAKRYEVREKLRGEGLTAVKLTK